MKGRIEILRKKAQEEIKTTQDLLSLEKTREEYFGKKKGALTLLLKEIPNLSEAEKKEVGPLLNEFKEELFSLYEAKRKSLREKKLSEKVLDVTLPGKRPISGSLHPLTLIIDETVEIFRRLGFQVFEGPDQELDLYNFQKLNIPENHPARDVQDTFYLDDKQSMLLRTHTSPGQIRFMEKHKPPLRILIPGVCYRRDAVDSTHLPQFHQIEGLLVDKETTFTNLKGALEVWAKAVFGEKIKTRFYPHFFPFTEPSAEMEILWKGRWLEVMGAGMVHPKVLQGVGLSPKIYQGWAFGMGVERIAMIKYGIEDIRLFYQNDLRFLKQF